jgi:hypothetical protein
LVKHPPKLTAVHRTPDKTGFSTLCSSLLASAFGPARREPGRRSSPATSTSRTAVNSASSSSPSPISRSSSTPEKKPLDAAEPPRKKKKSKGKGKKKDKTPAGNMFKRSFRSNGTSSQVPDPQHRVDKSTRLMKRNGGGGGGGATGGHASGAAGSVRDPQKLSRLQRSLSNVEAAATTTPSHKSLAPSPIVTLTVGREGRLFAAHEDVLCQSPFFEVLCRHQYLEAQSKRIALPEEEPEVFSAVLEYLYKGDYYPRLLHNKHRNSWELEDSVTPNNHHHRRTPHASPNLHHTETGGGRAAGSPYASPALTATTAAVEATVYLSSVGQHLLRDTVVYCAAERYGLEELKRLALRKQGLQSGIDVATILRSAQYCYAHTPDSDSRLRAHYLALIIRCRKTFKRSGTMQAEMERGGEGGKLFFDLFVALCNHLDDVIDASNSRTPKTI